MSLPNIKFADASTKLHHQDRAVRENVRFGQRMELDDGRKFRFVYNGAALLIVGDLIQGPAVISGDYTNLSVDAIAAIGDVDITFTGGTTTAADIYNEGTLHVNKSAAGLGGYVYRIKDHPIFINGAGATVELESFDPLRVALAASDEIGFLANPYNGVLQAIQTTLTNRVVGVACAPLTINYYGWVQTGGIAAVNSATSQVVGNIVTAVLAAAGRCGVAITASGATDANIDQTIGFALSVPDAAGEWGAVFLTMD